MRFAPAVAFAFLLVLAFGEAMAAPTAFGARTLEIPAPEGFVPASSEVPAYLDFAMGLVPPENRLVEAFLDPADKPQILAGKDARLKRYFQLQSMRQADGQTIAPADFTAAMSQMEAQLAQTIGNDDEEAKALDRSNANLERRGSDASAQQLSTRHAGVFRREPWGLFFTMIGTAQYSMEGTDQSITMITAGGIVLIDGQLVYLYANADADTPDAKAWAERSVSAWADATRAANGGK